MVNLLLFSMSFPFTEIGPRVQYEAAWRSGNWDFSLLHVDLPPTRSGNDLWSSHFNEKLHRFIFKLQQQFVLCLHFQLTQELLFPS